MSKLTEKFKDMTAILINSPFESEIPKKGELKDLLNVDDVFYYKRRGPYADDIHKIETALYIAENSFLPTNLYSFYSTKCSCLIVTNAGVSHGSFLKIKHPDAVVDGFNLDSQSWSDLSELLKKHEVAANVYFSFSAWVRTAEHNLEKFKNQKIIDSSVTQIDLNALHDQQKIYAVSALQSIHSDICSWVSSNRWK